MRLRYKILIILGSFIGFYFVLIPLLTQCNTSDSDCSVIQDLVLLTRPSIPVDIWENQKSLESSGSVQGVESPFVTDSIMMNQNFILSMIVFPVSIISAVVLWDKRK